MRHRELDRNEKGVANTPDRVQDIAGNNLPLDRWQGLERVD